MSVSTFKQPNSAAQTGAVYKAAIDQSIAAMLRLAGMFAPHQVEPVANMTVQIDAGSVFDGTALTERAQQTSGAITAPSVNPRRDLVYIDRATGALGIATGTEAASPADPTLPFNKLPVARIALSVGQTSITNADLTDLRNLTHLGLSLAAASAIGIGPEQIAINRNLGALAHANTIDAGDLRGTANRIALTDGSGLGTEGTVAGGLALSGGVLSATILRGQIDGLTLSNNGSDANNDIDIAAGQAADDSAAAYLSLAATLTKRLDAAWAVGSGNGGIDTGSKANSTWYHLWLIQRPDTGVVDALFSTSATAPTMPANYTRKRRIGAVLTDGSGNIRAFIQIGDRFYWSAPQATTSSSVSSTAILLTLVTPLGVKVEADLSMAIGTQASARFAWVSSPDQSDTAPSTTAAPAADIFNPAGAYGAGTKRVWTNTSSQVRVRADGAITAFVASVNSWLDPRGRNL